MKILLDTTIVFSGLGFPGNERQLLFYAIEKDFTLAITDLTFAELKRNIESKYTSLQKEEATVELLRELRS